ncbi:MAG: DNA adenine methylase [Gemmatimonadetes bacterium]|nr:DNA adenine methylase [Gemmatimonadota bacterium]
MRYLGNKTKLIPFILGEVERLIDRPGTACDPFAGTASVAAALKRSGWAVHSGDLLSASYALQVARVQLDRTPRFDRGLLPSGVANGARSVSYRDLLAWLSAQTKPGFVSEHYTLAGAEGRAHGRMYFSPSNGGRIDAIRDLIQGWESQGRITRSQGQLLRATLIEAADRVANTTGVYASFVKTLQPNAARTLELKPIRPTPRPRGSGRSRAFRGDAAALLEKVGTIDLVYLDPPYNSRQYPGYYHIPELLAVGWSDPPRIRGKTGLIPDEALRSDWCRKSEAEGAFREVLEASDGRHVLLSYNDEGLLQEQQIEAALRERGIADTYRVVDRPYKRYRADADGPARTYARDDVKERLYYIRCR